MPDIIRPDATGMVSHAPREFLHRHRHADPFVAIVISGAYEEAGDTGRHSLRPGKALVHGAYDGHLNRVSEHGASVLILRGRVRPVGEGLVTVADPDALLRAYERDPLTALQEFERQLTVTPSPADDWPEVLADDLRRNPALPLSRWAEQAGLSPESLSRGFRQSFGITPSQYRSGLRARKAIRLIGETGLPLKSVAAASGFADQPHMTRSVGALTGMTPAALRKLRQD